jgi:N-methylhydantoinase A
VLSGPAAGAIAGGHIGRLAGYANVITLDMGGTSADLALIEGGTPVQTTQGQIASRDVSVPMLDVHTISAGGGTIGWVDDVGLLRMGPRSAGADPGPACYGKGGAEPTVTDANVVLGYLDPDYFLGGAIRLDRAAAERAIEERIAAPLGMSLATAADGMLRIIHADMEQGVKAISSERGYDLRDFLLIAFGGAGPLAAGRLAAELGIPRVLVPIVPGATSAMGLLMADLRRSYVRSRLGLVDRLAPAEADAVCAELAERALAELGAEGFAPADVTLEYYLDMRYAGQGYELTVPDVAIPLDAAQLAALRSRFDALHERLHGHQAPAAPVEVVNYRLVAVVRVPKVEPRAVEPNGQPVEAALAGRRPVYFGELDRPVDCPVYDRGRLQPGHRLAGPAVVQQLDSTTIVYPGQHAEVDGYQNLILYVT